MQKCYILISVFFRGGMTFTYDGSEHFHHFMLLTVVGLNQQTFNMSWTSKRHVVGWKTTNAASQNLIMAACCLHNTGLPTQTLLPPISFIDLFAHTSPVILSLPLLFSHCFSFTPTKHNQSNIPPPNKNTEGASSNIGSPLLLDFDPCISDHVLMFETHKEEERERWRERVCKLILRCITSTLPPNHAHIPSSALWLVGLPATVCSPSPLFPLLPLFPPCSLPRSLSLQLVSEWVQSDTSC